jgi:hypothetical protein
MDSVRLADCQSQVLWNSLFAAILEYAEAQMCALFTGCENTLYIPAVQDWTLALAFGCGVVRALHMWLVIHPGLRDGNDIIHRIEASATSCMFSCRLTTLSTTVPLTRS